LLEDVQKSVDRGKVDLGIEAAIGTFAKAKRNMDIETGNFVLHSNS